MPKKKIDYHEHNTDLPETTSVASANECTGLMPSSPKSEAERESFEQLSPMAIPRHVPVRGMTQHSLRKNHNRRTCGTCPCGASCDRK